MYTITGIIKYPTVATLTRNLDATPRYPTRMFEGIPSELSREERVQLAERKRKLEVRAKRNKERIAAGLCCRCGKNPSTGTKRCAECKKKNNEQRANRQLTDEERAAKNLETKEYREKRKEELLSKGICFKCGKEPSRGTRMGENCLKKSNATQRVAVAKRRKNARSVRVSGREQSEGGGSGQEGGGESAAAG